MSDSAAKLSMALAADFSAIGFHDAELELMPGTGVSHNHYRITGTDWILRAAHLSQSGMDAAGQLTIQAAAFDRAAQSGATPKLKAVFRVSDALPRGGLIVEQIGGRLPQSAAYLPDMARALAAIHSLPMPTPSKRAPIPHHMKPFVPLAANVKATLEVYLGSAGLTAKSQAIIKKRLQWLIESARHDIGAPITCLTVSDAHPGNFRILDNGRAVFVDLEKPAYSCPTIDLAHAVIGISSAWDPAAGLVLSAADRQAFIDAWLEAVPASVATAAESRILMARRAVWLRTISFFMKWRKESAVQGPWSAERLGKKAASHFRLHVDTSLSEAEIMAAAGDWE
jgi:hypothetical protein